MRRREWVLPGLVIGTILCLFVPVPPIALDVLLTMNIISAVVILAAVVGVADPVEFSAFPTLLLVTTGARLALTVSATRLILLNGYAGQVIETMGHVVVGSSLVVGLVIFAVITIVNLLVITKGTERASEVAARFALDAMPGKQMAVDADLAAGLLDEHAARQARRRITREADFYGAMDGAVKFVKGDAIAAIVIAMVNLFGGFTIGVLVRNMSLGDAANTYALLTIGDGLVAQIPALLLSFATGMLVNRVRSDNPSIGTDIFRQAFQSKVALRAGAFAAVLIGLLPGMPKPLFFGVAIALLVVAARVKVAPVEPEIEPEGLIAVSKDDPEVLLSKMRVDEIELRLAYDCVDLVATGDLLSRVKELRHQVALELGLLLPPVSTTEDASLPQGEYRIAVNGVDVGAGEVPPGFVMALPDPMFGGNPAALSRLGTKVTEPVFGLEAFRVSDASRAEAAAAGATIVDRSAAIVTHLAEVTRRHAADLLSLQQTSKLVAALGADQAILANEISADRVPMTVLHQVLRELLAERVSIRDLATIVESLIGLIGKQATAEQAADVCRQALGSQVVARLAPDGRLAAVMLQPELERTLAGSIIALDGTSLLAADPAVVHQVVAVVYASAQQLDAEHGLPVAVVCSSPLRRPLSTALHAAGVDIEVLAYPELKAHVQVVDSVRVEVPIPEAVPG